ncbi:MAG TPA: hypothetical protein PLS49_08070 [Candidatus Woesebacteria bacterium]|nr:hypothetical protein [Candidatus Woesebacteria bacterium]
MATWPKLLAGLGMVTARPTQLRFPGGETYTIPLRIAVNSITHGSQIFEGTNVVIEKLDESPLDLGTQAVQITPRGGEPVVVSYTQFANLFS